MSQENIRNFCIIAHIDHGKSTLADRLLEFTGTIEKRKMKEQVLDQMDLERERGITIKLQPVRMVYQARTNADYTQTNADTGAQTDTERKLLYEDLTYKIRGAAFAVRKKVGLGHKEIIYQNALQEELKKLNLNFEKEKIVDVNYDGKKIGIYKPDFIVDEKIIVEIKALPFMGKKEEMQMWTYLKGSNYKLLLLINFSSNDVYFKRIVYDSARDDKCLRKSASSQRKSAEFILNLIDTPGHVDFNYEVSRSLAAVEGAVLLVDAAKGVQAQTLSNLYLAIEQGLEIIPVVNKIDLPNANAEKTKKEILHILGCREEEIILASGKTGEGVEKILERVIEKIPAPKGNFAKPLRALIFDSKYDAYKGVLAYVRIVDGGAARDDKIYLIASRGESSVIEVGYFKPELVPADSLSAGEIGYIATGFKSVDHCRVGDTITNARTYADSTRTNAEKVEPLAGYKEVKPMVYASFYPIEGSDYNMMRDALEKLKLNDAAFVFEPESSPALGKGFRCGFLGLLHLEIVQARLEREFDLFPTVTAPSVVYEVELKGSNGPKLKVYSPVEMPDPASIEKIYEPYVKLNIISPSNFLGPIMEMMKSARAEYLNTEYIDSERIILSFNAPLTDVIVNLHDDLKSASSGYASMNYEFSGYRPNDLVKLDILVAGEKVDAFSRIAPESRSFSEGKRIVEKLKDSIPRQNFQVALQAAIGGKIIARETIKAFRKDVTDKLYGGDVTRKRKLLEKQKKGKKKMKSIGRVNIPSEAFLAVLKK